MNTSEYGNFGVLRLTGTSPYRWALPSAWEMKRLDQGTINSGISSLELMQRAGTAIAQGILEKYGSSRRFVVLCGPGNNGGDGLVLTQVLRQAGCVVEAVVAGASKYSPECLEQMAKCGSFSVVGRLPDQLDEAGLSPKVLDEDELSERISKSDVVVDALLGTGQKAAPRESISSMVACLTRAVMCSSSIKIVSVDIPTGLDADTGAIFEPRVQADTTFSVEFIKRGMVQFPGRAICGDIEVVSIGIGGGHETEFSALEDTALPRLIARSPDVHKGALGRVLIVGGSSSMPGAALLAAMGALRAGAGIVSRLVKRPWLNTLMIPECMNELIMGDGDCFTEADSKGALDVCDRFDTLVIGPGLGLANETGEFLRGVFDGLRRQKKRVVIDADAINLVASHKLSLQGLEAIMTPHPGEAARLLGQSTAAIQADRFAAAKALSSTHGVVSLLKGAGTLVYSGSKGVVIVRGTPYLATPGSGDVLAGLIGTCFSRSNSAFEAACLGGWIHAQAGMLAATEAGGPILATDIAKAVSAVIGKFEQ